MEDLSWLLTRGALHGSKVIAHPPAMEKVGGGAAGRRQGLKPKGDEAHP
jgi:hypothetical protein